VRTTYPASPNTFLRRISRPPHHQRREQSTAWGIASEFRWYERILLKHQSTYDDKEAPLRRNPTRERTSLPPTAVRLLRYSESSWHCPQMPHQPYMVWKPIIRNTIAGMRCSVLQNPLAICRDCLLRFTVERFIAAIWCQRRKSGFIDMHRVNGSTRCCATVSPLSHRHRNHL
jgi:hypothetical protein